MFPVQDDEHTEFALLYLLNRLTVSNSTCIKKGAAWISWEPGRVWFFSTDIIDKLNISSQNMLENNK